MTHPPLPPAPDGPDPSGRPSHDATQAFPVGGAPPPPPPEQPSVPPAPPASAPAPPASPSHEATQALPVGGVPPAPPPDPFAAPPVAAPAAGGWSVAPGAAPATAVGGQGWAGGPAGSGAGAGGVAPPGAVPAAGPAPGGRSTGRIVARALVVLLVVGALVGAVAWGLVNRSSAEEWRDRARTAEADLTRSLERVQATEAELEEARVRLRELANEKAGEADENRVLSEIVAQAPAVTAALADCQAETAMLANELIAALGTEAPDLSGLQARTDDVNAICDDALAQAQQLEDTIDGLG